MVATMLNSFAVVAPKPGAICSKLGTTSVSAGKRFTCIKSGKKLVWNSGVPVTPSIKPSSSASPTPNSTATPQKSMAPQPSPSQSDTVQSSPSPTPSSTPAPTSTATWRDETAPGYEKELSPVTEAAFKDFIQTYMSRLTDEKPNINYIVEPNMDPVKVKEIKDTVDASAIFFANERPIAVKTNIWISMSRQFQWLYDNLKSSLSYESLDGGWLEAKLERSKKEPNFMGGGAPGDGRDGVAVLFFNRGDNSSWGNSFWSQVPGHEYAHVVQRYELNGTMAPMLCWVREGNANFYGWLIAGRNSQGAFRNFWLQALSQMEQLGGVPNPTAKSAGYWSNLFIENELKSPAECDPWLNYILGAMAFQYLAGTYGNQKIQDFYLGLRDGWRGTCSEPLNSRGLPCESWKKVFLKSFGITGEDAYPKFGKYIVDELKWAQGKTVLWDSDALKIAPIPIR